MSEGVKKWQFDVSTRGTKTYLKLSRSRTLTSKFRRFTHHIKKITVIHSPSRLFLDVSRSLPLK